MDSDKVVEKLIDGGQKLVEELAKLGFDMTAAFWVKTCEVGKWKFYIVSPMVDTEGSAKAYGSLNRVLRSMPRLFGISPLKIRLIGPSEPMARDVIAILNHPLWSRELPIRWGSISLGNESVEEFHLYPLPLATPIAELDTSEPPG